MSFWKTVRDGFSRFGAPLVKTREYLPLAAGVALTLAAVFIARNRIDSVEKTIREKASPVDVVVASCAIPKGTVLSPQSLAKLSVPSSGTSRRNVPAAEFELLVGARTKTSIETGEPIFWTDVEEPFEVETFSQAIPQGRRALTIEADLGASFSGLIRPGDRVDIWRQDAAGHPPRAWLNNIPVIAVDRDFDHPPDSEESPEASSITLSVTPEEGMRLVAAPTGELRWFLRNPDDRSRTSLPSRPDSGAHRPVEIWKAGVRESGTRTAALEVAD